MSLAVEPLALQKLDSVTFDTLLEHQNPFGQPGGVFDLTGVELVTPAALVQLAAACHALAEDGRQPVVVVPALGVRTYLLRAGFGRAVESVGRIEPPALSPASRLYERRRGTNPMLIEVQKIEAGADLPALLDQIVWVLLNRLRYRKNDAFDAAVAVSEIAQNTFDHCRRSYGFIAMQVYGGESKRFLEIGVADYGDGLGATLRRNPKNPVLRSDLEAIQCAIKLGVSAHDDPTRGTGLHHLLEIAYKHEGSVQIRSGEAKVRYRMDKRRGWGFSVPHMRGVQIALTLRAKEAA